MWFVNHYDFVEEGVKVMEIIEARIEHFDKVYELICELEQASMNRQALYQVYTDNLSNKDIYYLLVVCGSEVIGFASLHIQRLLHHASSIGELQEIIICDSKRGLGIGNMLFNHIKKVAAEQGCSELEVCCSQKRKESHKFYLKNDMKNSHYKFTMVI